MRMTSLYLGVLLGLLCLPNLNAQDDIPRRPDGKPDLSGTYDVAWLTPYQRNPKYGESPYLSEEEARNISVNAAASLETAIAPIAGDRPPPPVGGDGHPSNVGGHNIFWWDRGTGAFAIDGRYRNSVITEPADGRLPPLTEKGKALQPLGLGVFNKNTGDAWWLEESDYIFNDPELQTLTTRCLYTGGATIPIRPSTYNNLKTIVQTDSEIVLHVEWQHWTRIVRLDSEHRLPEMISWGGDSIGWWEGDTLVVDTTNFRRAGIAHLPEARRYSKGDKDPMRSPGEPHEGLHVVERFRRIDKDTLLYEFTVEDPDYTAPYAGSLPWPRTDHKLYEYACHEGNYSMGLMLRGARVLEKEWYEKHPDRKPQS